MTKHTFISIILTLTVSVCFSQQYGTFKDPRDGKVYKTVKIGSQEWMAENLNVTKFQNGDFIPQAITRYDWNEANKNKTPAWCYVDYNSKNEIIYNLYAVLDRRGIAPKGWRVPTIGEFIQLVIHVKNIRSRKDTINDKWSLPSNMAKLQSKYQWIIRRPGSTRYKTYMELRKDSIELNEKLSKELNSNVKELFQRRMNELIQELSEVNKFETGWNERANNSGFSAIPTNFRKSTIFDSRYFKQQEIPSIRFYKNQSFENYFEWETGIFNICSSLEKNQYENTKNMWPVEGAFSVIDDTIYINPPRYLSKSEMKFVNKQEYKKSNLPYQDIIYKIILNKKIDTIFNSSKDASQNEKYYLKKRLTINSIITYDLSTLRVIDFPDTITIDPGNNWKFQNGEYINSASANWWTTTQFHDTKFENQVGHKCSKECEHPLFAYVFRITDHWPYQLLWSQKGWDGTVFNPEWMNGGSGLSLRCLKENSQLIIDTADADYLAIPLAKREEFGVKANPILKVETTKPIQKNADNITTKNTSNFVKLDPKSRHICESCKGKKFYYSSDCSKCENEGVIGCISCHRTGFEQQYEGMAQYRSTNIKCIKCRGQGFLLCPECNGKPQLRRYNCESCEGIGYKKYVVCNYCKGELPKKNELSPEMNAFIFGKCNMCEGSGKLSRPLSY